MKNILFYIIFGIFILGTIGWIKDINKLIHTDFKSPYKAEVIYGIGAFTGLGAVIGWLNIKD